MYIMRRMGHVEGLAGVEKAAEATQIVQNAGVPASFWVGGPGSIPGSVAWSVMVDSVAQWAEYTDALAADAAYDAFSRQNVGVITMPQVDTLSEIVHGDLGGGSDVGDYIGALQAVPHPERAVDAAAFAVEVADAFSATTGLQAVVTKNLAGDQGTIEWLVRYGAAAAIDDAEAKTAASEDYAAVLAKSVGLFTSGTRMFARRAG